jgi:hypothetical protein
MLAWNAEGTYLQRTNGVSPVGAALVVPELGPGFGNRDKALARWRQNWWMGLHVFPRIEAYTLSDTEVLEHRILVTDSRCPDTCPLGVHFDVRTFSAVMWGEDLWFGFEDFTNNFGTSEEHPVRSKPYRIVRIKDGCTYRSAYDLHGTP